MGLFCWGGAPWTKPPLGPVTLTAKYFPFLGSCSTSNSTSSPSARERKPWAWIEVWWTKTSADPSAGVMKPKPFTTSKNFTRPEVLNLKSNKARQKAQPLTRYWSHLKDWAKTLRTERERANILFYFIWWRIAIGLILQVVILSHFFMAVVCGLWIVFFVWSRAGLPATEEWMIRAHIGIHLTVANPKRVCLYLISVLKLTIWLKIVSLKVEIFEVPPLQVWNWKRISVLELLEILFVSFYCADEFYGP